LAPLLLPADLRLSPEQFAAVCIANPQAVLELTAEGHLIHMTPTGGETGARNSRLLMRLFAWGDGVGGWRVFDSSTGFRLPVAARLLRRSWLGAQPRSAGRTRQPGLRLELAEIWED
jgi:Uma2 family endonuclease